jgi:hypothetical protein
MLDFNFDLLHDGPYQDKDYEIAYLSNGSRPGEGDEVLGWEACFRSVVSLDALPQ